MKKVNLKNKQQARRLVRIRKKISQVSDRPRLTVFRSNVNIYAQIIDDAKAVTLVSASSHETKDAKKLDQAMSVGKLIAEKAKAAKITKVVFDKGAYKFHGRVKALAESAREGGLQF